MQSTPFSVNGNRGKVFLLHTKTKHENIPANILAGSPDLTHTSSSHNYTFGPRVTLLSVKLSAKHYALLGVELAHPTPLTGGPPNCGVQNNSSQSNPKIFSSGIQVAMLRG